MSTSKTEHLQLHRWALDDYVQTEEINENFTKLDESVAAAVGAAAEGLRVVSGTYVGTGTNGSNGPCVLTFAERPLFVLILGNFATTISGAADEGNWSPVSGSTGTAGPFTWLGNILQWNHSSSANYQMNTAGVTYHYLAFYRK